jgi:hypothetical protein
LWRWWSFHALVSGSQREHHDSSPLTIKPKNTSPSFLYCSRCSKQTPLQVVFCFTFKLFSKLYSRNLPTCQNLHDNVMHIFHADMQNHYMIITHHHLIHFYMCVWVSKVGLTTRTYQVLSAAPTLFEPCATVKHHCLLLTVDIHLLHLRMNVCRSRTFRTQKLGDTALYMLGQIQDCPAQSNTLLCRDNTEQPAYAVCLSWSVVTTIRQHKNG